MLYAKCLPFYSGLNVLKCRTTLVTLLVGQADFSKVFFYILYKQIVKIHNLGSRASKTFGIHGALSMIRWLSLGLVVIQIHQHQPSWCLLGRMGIITSCHKREVIFKIIGKTGHKHKHKCRGWVIKLNSLFRTADFEVHIVHTSCVIIT